MASIYDVNANDLISKVAEELKKLDQIKAPEWSIFVKTGVHKERPPVEADWWYTRAAAILRSVAILGPLGVEKLRTKYGGNKNRGVKPEHFFKGSGNIIRKCLQQLEAAELIKKTEKGSKKGRVVAPKGQSLLDTCATIVRGPKTSKKEAKPEVKKEKPQAEEVPTTEIKEESKDQE